MDDEICTMEKCDTEIMDTEVSQSSSRDYDMEISEDEKASDSTGSMEDPKTYVEDITDDNLKQTGKADAEIGNSENIMDDSSAHSERPVPAGAKSLIIVDDNSVLRKKRDKDIHVASDIKSDLELANSELVTRLEDAESRYNELATRLFMFEEKFNDMQKKMTDELESSGDKLSTLESDLYSKAHESDYKRLRQDFDLFSKRLRRVVQAEDSVNAESLDPTKVPSDVLEITYAKTLNDILNAMIAIYGERESFDMVETARDSVREFSAGVDFFRFENEAFIVRGLSDAISSKIVSVKQIHGTYVELFKMLSQYVPNYNSQDFRSFVETGSREYTIEKVVAHEKHLDRIVSDLTEHKGELDNLTENVSFMAELQNNQLEEAASNTQQLEEIMEQIKSIAKAVNLHTKAITKLNRTLKELDFPEPVADVAEKSSEELADSPIPTQESDAPNASKEQIMAIAGEIESFKVVVGGMFNSLQEQLHIHIPGYEESFIHDYPDEQIVHQTEVPVQDNAIEDVFPEDSPDINAQADQLEQEEFLPEPSEVTPEPDQIFEEQSPAQAETAELTPEPLNLEDFAPDQDNLVPEAESMPVDFGSLEVVPDEVPLDLESLDMSPDAAPVDFESSEDVAEEVPLDLESLDLSPDAAPVDFDSPEDVAEEVPLDLESLDLSPDEVPVDFDSPEVVPEEVPLDLDSLDLSPDEVPVDFESSEVVPEEVPLDLGSLDISPDEVPVDFESSEDVAEEVPLDLDSLDLSPDAVPVDFESSEVVPEEVPLDLESLDMNPDEVPVGFESSEVVPEEVPLDLESLDLSPDEILENSKGLTLSEADIVTEEASEQPQPIRLKDMPIEEVIIGQLSIAGSATLKQLEKQIKSSGYPIDFEKLSLVMGYLEQEQMVDTVKKGRYTFYSVAGTVNV
ncbi:MAG: hypothetical protein PWQ75_2002 [Methanolobus sp.]|jgi:hypothetical protein|uniref:hypothetical protein n=1 Tax=Methanolobus sp. TaxID=1874737 RepID=UPI002589C486|nr:hypothetical protein [Methanolobus sp.]MDK2832250.1 hypothetical protein [Methanolobus sp.]